MPLENTDSVCKPYVDSGFNDPSILQNNGHVDFNDKNLDDVCFVKVKSLPAICEHLALKFYFDEALSHSVDEPSLLRLDLNGKLKLDE